MKSVCRKFGLMLMFWGFTQIAFPQDTTIVQGKKDVQELRYFKSDDAFYLGDKRLLDSEIEMALSNNLSAFDAWNRGNHYMKVNNAMKITTGVCLGVGFGLAIVWPFFIPVGDYAAMSCIIGGATLLTTGVVTGIMIPITKSKYKFYYSDAAGIYNKSKNTVSLHIGATSNGLGFNLKF